MKNQENEDMTRERKRREGKEYRIRFRNSKELHVHVANKNIKQTPFISIKGKNIIKGIIDIIFYFKL